MSRLIRGIAVVWVSGLILQIAPSRSVDANNAQIQVAPAAAPVRVIAVQGQEPAAASNIPQAGGGQPAGGQPANSAGPVQTVTNIEDKEFKAAQLELQEGKLIVKSDPPQSIPLNELQRVGFASETRLEAKWIGQENRDLVQVGTVDEGNGIQDVHVHLSGLAAKNLNQVVLISRPQFRVWRKDAARSPYWKIAIERIGQASGADLYFEPPTKDLFETELELTVTFDDNSTAKTTLKASGHTSDQLKIETPVNVRRLVTLQLEGGDSLKGRIVEGQAEHVVVETAWMPAFQVPLLQVRGIVFDGIKPEVKTKFDEKMAKPPEDDILIVLSKDGGVADVSGRVQSIGETSLTMVYEEKERTVKLERVQAVVFGAHPLTRRWKGPFQVFRMSSGDQISAYWSSLGEKIFEVKSPWESDLELPREAVVEVTGRNTKMVNVSELTPAAVEQVPYFDRVIPWVKDKSWNNRPLRLDDKIYNRGLAVHSRCVLTYDLNGEFVTFRSLVGFDEDAGDRGRVVCRVLVDDKELFAKPDLRAGEKAVPIELSVKGAKQLRLEVDFGDDEDVGDRVIWANARLYRE